MGRPTTEEMLDHLRAILPAAQVRITVEWVPSAGDYLYTLAAVVNLGRRKEVRPQGYASSHYGHVLEAEPDWKSKINRFVAQVLDRIDEARRGHDGPEGGR